MAMRIDNPSQGDEDKVEKSRHCKLQAGKNQGIHKICLLKRFGLNFIKDVVNQ